MPLREIARHTLERLDRRCRPPDIDALEAQLLRDRVRDIGLRGELQAHHGLAEPLATPMSPPCLQCLPELLRRDDAGGHEQLADPLPGHHTPSTECVSL